MFRRGNRFYQEKSPTGGRSLLTFLQCYVVLTVRMLPTEWLLRYCTVDSLTTSTSMLRAGLGGVLRRVCTHACKAFSVEAGRTTMLRDDDEVLTARWSHLGAGTTRLMAKCPRPRRVTTPRPQAGGV